MPSSFEFQTKFRRSTLEFEIEWNLLEIRKVHYSLWAESSWPKNHWAWLKLAELGSAPRRCDFGRGGWHQ
jgi:hypothetical protein